jgi:DNA-binding NtrC family response regulator
MGNLARVLLVDDEPGVRATLAANLELSGLDVVTASSGAAAIELSTKEGPFDLVLSDVRMPGMSGAELVRRLRSVQPGVPVILMTGFAKEELLAEALADGAFTVLMKPFDVDEVARIVLRASKRPFVLVVDEPAQAAVLTRQLEEAGLRTRAVQSAGEALLVVGYDTVDVCLVEAALSAEDGASLTGKIRKKNPDVAVIAVTAAGSAVLLARAAENGAFGCVERPVDTASLVRLIAKARGSRLA